MQAQEALNKIKKEYDLTIDKRIERLNIAPKYANALFVQNFKTEAYQVLESNIRVATQQKDGQYASILYATQALSYRQDNKKKESEKSLSLAKKYALQTTSIEAKGYLNYAEGWIQIRDNKTADAVTNLLEAISYYENSTTNSTYFTIYAYAVKELAAIYANLGEYQLEEKYSKQFLLLASRQNDPNLLFDAYMRMGYIYERKYIENPSNNILKAKVEQYYLQAINTFKKNLDSMFNKSNLSYVSINLANHYLGFDRSKAQEYAELANRVSIEIGKAVHIAASFGILSELAIEDNNYDLAKSYLLRASSEIEKSTISDPNIELSLLVSLSEICEQQGNNNEALTYYKKYIAKYQSVYDQEKLNITKRLESQFEHERQEQKYSKLQLESDKKEQQIVLMDIVRKQREQMFNNLKLVEENQSTRLKFAELQSEKQAQQLRLSKLETDQKNRDIFNYKKLVAYKDKINASYRIFIIIFILVAVLLLYIYKERAKSNKQKEELYGLEIERERQKSKISTLTALLQGQEQERNRLAHDLHDGLGGLLSGIKLQLSHINPNQSMTIHSEITKSISQIDGAVDELRRVAHNLMPELLQKYGLEATVRDFASRMENHSLKIYSEFIYYSNSLSQEKQLFLYRIIQELVGNAIKHAEASEIIIQICEEENLINLTVEDDGKGFNVDKAETRNSAGFHNIASRVQFLKGTINIRSEIATGTSIEISIPIL